MCMRYVLTEIVHAILNAPRKLTSAIKRAIHRLANDAQRAHPKRDAKSGRLKLGLQHVFGTPYELTYEPPIAPGEPRLHGASPIG